MGSAFKLPIIAWVAILYLYTMQLLNQVEGKTIIANSTCTAGNYYNSVALE